MTALCRRGPCEERPLKIIKKRDRVSPRFGLQRQALVDFA